MDVSIDIRIGEGGGLGGGGLRVVLEVFVEVAHVMGKDE